MRDRLQHDLCRAVAWRVLDIIRPSICDGEARDAYAEFYEIALQEIGHYEQASTQRDQRLRPMGEPP